MANDQHYIHFHPLTDYAKSWVLKSTGKKWRNVKSNLKKKHYKTHATNEERLAVCDGRVLPEQWYYLVQFWNSDKGHVCKELSITNATSRSKQKNTHTAGSKSFARIHEERKKRPNGEEPTRADLFILTRTGKNGRPMDEAFAKIITKLKDYSTQQPETSQRSAARDGIFSQVVGGNRHGLVRTYGLGPCPSDLWGTIPGRVKSMRMASEVRRACVECAI